MLTSFKPFKVCDASLFNLQGTISAHFLSESSLSILTHSVSFVKCFFQITLNFFFSNSTARLNSLFSISYLVLFVKCFFRLFSKSFWTQLFNRSALSEQLCYSNTSSLVCQALFSTNFSNQLFNWDRSQNSLHILSQEVWFVKYFFRPIFNVVCLDRFSSCFGTACI